MSQQKQNQHTGTPNTSRNPLEQGSDDRAKNLAEEARKLQEEAERFNAGLDPRRSMDIRVEKSSARALLYINNTLWAEVDWSQGRKAFCIQDCFGYCLNHVEHVVKEVAFGGDISEVSSDTISQGMDRAIEIAKQMIKDGRMRSPEEAKEFAIKNNTSARRYYRF